MRAVVEALQRTLGIDLEPFIETDDDGPVLRNPARASLLAQYMPVADEVDEGRADDEPSEGKEVGG